MKAVSQWETLGVLDALLKHYSGGLSHAQIAIALNLEFKAHFSRSAIVGKCDRLGLQKREPIKQQARHYNPSIDDAYAPPETRKTLIELGNNDCRWPYGDGPFTFCGKPEADLIGKKPYCPYHTMVRDCGSQTANNCISEAAA